MLQCDFGERKFSSARLDGCCHVSNNVASRFDPLTSQLLQQEILCKRRHAAVFGFRKKGFEGKHR